ncbi:MAG: UbiX family flavin prenyltransferase [Candidatus Abyssobacteria bacterium SURF_5]|uniref:Flavin prenyltransferase UbiX n=1 Tax=Abyssobacteria bacterium (strain SURF_5) TaxID=2093360 RepID=A0A3A4N3L6_ABYX5|nr:MAG: UbiX family flavin prenyltransferase [Candidatus Abyssubacteria bacterium SURF_5]
MTTLPSDQTKRFTVAISGASGALYAVRLLQALIEREHKVYLTISKPASLVLQHELKLAVDLSHFSVERLVGRAAPHVSYYHYEDVSAPIASGSFPIDAMVVVPCSMSTLAGVASGLGTNLILRAAEVTLKERRPLVLVPRETPLGIIEIENMLRASRAGACILPAAPAFYHDPRDIDDMVGFVVGKVLNQLGAGDHRFGWGKGA